MKELGKTGSIKIWLYNPQISPKSVTDLYMNDIKIGLVFADDKLCSCSAVFFSLFQHCSMNDSSQQWLTRPVSSPKVTVNSWKIEPLLCRGKNKAPHPQSRAPPYTDREGEGGPREQTRHPHSMLTHKPSNHALQRPLFGTGGRPLFSLNCEVRPHHKNRQECKQAFIVASSCLCLLELVTNSLMCILSNI